MTIKGVLLATTLATASGVAFPALALDLSANIGGSANGSADVGNTARAGVGTDANVGIGGSTGGGLGGSGIGQRVIGAVGGALGTLGGAVGGVRAFGSGAAGGLSGLGGLGGCSGSASGGGAGSSLGGSASGTATSTASAVPPPGSVVPRPASLQTTLNAIANVGAKTPVAIVNAAGTAAGGASPASTGAAARGKVQAAIAANPLFTRRLGAAGMVVGSVAGADVAADGALTIFAAR